MKICLIQKDASGSRWGGLVALAFSLLACCLQSETVLAAPTIAYVQGNYATPQTSQATVSVKFNSAQTAGNLNVIVVGWNDSTAAVNGVSDTQGNAYTLAVGPTKVSGALSQSVYYAKNIAAAAAGSNTVTVSFSSAAKYPDIRILEYTGADPNNPVDVTAAKSGSGTSSSSGAATTTNATDLIFGANIVTSTTSGAGTGFTKRLLTSPDGDIAEDEMATSAGSYSASAPLSSGQWIMQMVAFRTPTGGPALPTVSSVSPNSGPTAGGTSVTITGTNFATGATVTFGAAAATNVAVVNATTITATTPAGTAGAVTVTVTVSGQSGSLANGFTYVATPTVTSVSPNTGSTAGGTSVTITGTNFASGATVTFGSSAATNVVVANATTITATTPAGSSGAATVKVTVSGQSGSLTNGFTYVVIPTVTSVSPNTGSTAGGTAVTITGTNFASGATVTFGTAAATNVVVVNASTITATTSAGSAGAVTVTVTVSGQTGSLANGFTYVAAPTVTSVSPNTGSTAGGTSVTLTGTNFASGATVTFGSTPATNVVVANGTTITATTPAGSAGAVTVTVTVSGQSGSLTNGFTYVVIPTVTSVSPNTGSTAGGTSVTITGTNFATGATVTFGSSAATNVVVVSATTITATTPAGSVGAVTVIVTVSGQNGNLANGFTYVATPTVTSVSPNTGSTAGGTSVTITGTNFASGATVTFGSTPGTNVVVGNSTTITATAPAGSAGAVTVTVTVSGQSGGLTNGFTYVVVPTVTSVSPNSGPTAGGTAVTITGTNFAAGAGVTIGGVTATNVVVVNGTTITATTPAGAAGAATVTVTLNGQSGSLTNGFTYLAPPTVTSVSPNTGSIAGGTSVTITGTNFASGATVTFGSNPATNVVVANSTTITATTPAGAAGAVTVTVTVGGQSGSLTSGFTYDVITTISYVQGNYSTPQSSQSSVPVTFTAAQTAGDLNVVVVGWNDTTATVSSVTDSKGNSYTRAVGPAAISGVLSQSIYYAKNIAAAAAGANIVTVTFSSAAAYPDIRVLEYSGADQNNPVDVTAAATGNSASSSSGAATTTNATDLIFGANIVTSTTSGAGTGFTKRLLTSPDGDIAEDEMATSAGSYSATAPLSSGQWIMQMVAFRTPSGGPAVPTVSSVSPNSGPTAGGTSVTITGTNFATGATATFGTAAATNVVVVNATMITAVTPAGSAGAVTVTVTISGHSGNLANGFTYTAPVTVATPTFNPGAGTYGSAQSVSIASTTNGATICYTTNGSTPAANTPGTCSTGTALANGGNVTVSASETLNAIGTETGFTNSAVGSSSYTISPCVQNLAIGNFTLCGETYNDVSTGTNVQVNYSPSPNNGIIAWATWCFNSACNSSISGVTATIGDNINATESCFVASPHSPFITDANGGGQGSGDFQQHYVWYCPNIPSGVTSFTVTPSNPNLSYLQLNITEWKAGSLAASCSPIGACFESVDNFGQAGNSTGGTTATITTSGSTVNANDLIFAVTEVPCCSFTAGPGTGYTGITVAPSVTPGMVSEAKAATTTGIQTATTTWAGGTTSWFGVIVPIIGAGADPPMIPTVTSLSPSSGPPAGGTSVTITGTNFASGATVTFGTAAATNVVVVNATTITATAPAGSAGAVTVTVTVSGQSGSLTNGFTYVVVPTVTSVSPNSGPTAGGTAVTITGTNFAAGAGVTVGGVAATNVVVVNGTTITATTPAGTAGAATVTVTLNGQSGSLTNGFTYLAPPTVTSVSPNTGSTAGGTSVTITGTNFASGATVTFGSNPATNVVVANSTTITATTPAGAAGAVTVGVTVGGQSGSLTSGFTFNVITTISYVQGNYATPQSSQTSVKVGYPAAENAGDLNVVVVGWNDSTATVSSIADTQGNLYVQAVGPTVVSGTLSQSIYYAANILAGTNTVTVTFSGPATSADIRILEYSGADPSNPVDVTAASSGSGTNSNSGAATTANATDLIFGANVVTGLTSGPGSGFTQRLLTSPDGDIAEDMMVTSTGSYSATAPMSSGTWIMQMVAFRTPSGCSGAPPTAPGSLIATAVGGSQISLTWTSSTSCFGISDYVVQRCVGAGCSNFSQVGTSTATNFTDSSVAPGTSYSYQVQAIDNVGNAGPFSNAASATTAAISISPRVVPLTFTRTQQFTSSGSSNVIWSVDGVNGGNASTGTISSTGLYAPPGVVGTHTVTVTSSDLSHSASATVYIVNYAGTYTRDVDNMRSGLNPSETVLTTGNVNVNTFGKVGSYAIDGVADASPLYVANLQIPGQGFHNVVYVATEHDSVYAFDADGLQSAPLWQVSFLSPQTGVTTVPAADEGGCSAVCDITPEIGITGSPVIDPTTNTLYVVAKTKEISGSNTNYVHRLHALDITTGAEKFGGPVVISASVAGTGSGSSSGQLPFISLRENQRSALLLSNGVVYLAFAAHGDVVPWHGWVLGYNSATLAQTFVFNTSPNDNGSGIWMSGDGLATDSSGNLFFVTGNGTFDVNTGGVDYGDSLLRLDQTSGSVAQYFTPYDQANMNANDLDLGSGGVTLLPDQAGSTAHPHLALTAGKNGTIYLVDRDAMGGYNPNNNNQVVQTVVNEFPGGTFETGNFKAPVYWNGNLYYSADADYLKSFSISNAQLSTTPTSETNSIFSYPGTTLALSSNGNASPILWAIQRVDLDPSGGGTVGPGLLHAFDATNLGNELYNSSQAAGGRDVLDYTCKWSAPLVANGRVYVASEGYLTIFGLLP